MKKFLFFLMLLSFYVSTPLAAQNRIDSSTRKEVVVYVCESKTSYAYHTSDRCRGLNRCTHTIVKMKEKDALAARGTACKVCH